MRINNQDRVERINAALGRKIYSLQGRGEECWLLCDGQPCTPVWDEQTMAAHLTGLLFGVWDGIRACKDPRGPELPAEC